LIFHSSKVFRYYFWLIFIIFNQIILSGEGFCRPFRLFWNKKIKTMKKIVLVYGLLSGAIVGAMFFITMPLYERGILTMENGELVGYSTMVVALSLIFFGVKSYRDNYLSGSITFGKALTVGLLITLIASLIYAITWEVIYNTMTDFVKEMGDKYFEKLRAEGTT
jgi:hypothetical protein